MILCKRVLILVALHSLNTLSPPVYAARILGVFSLMAKSHQQFIKPVMVTLAQAGHDVTVYSHFPVSNPPPNYKEVSLGEVPVLEELVGSIILETMKVPVCKAFDIFFSSGQQILHEFLQYDKIRQLLHSNEHFDLVISETFVMQEFTLIFGHIFKAPVIGIQTFATSKWLSRNVGNSLSLSHIPDVGVNLPSRMTFSERLHNTWYSLRCMWWVYDFYVRSIEKPMRDHFPDMPPLWDLIDNVSLVFVNDHIAADYPQPRTPNLIPIAGLHIRDPKPLPNDIQTFMDNAPQGVILFSFGTYIPDDQRSEEYFRMFTGSFRRLRQRVLWKTRVNIKELTDNVKTQKWMPQQEILAHPNCVLFITHGGFNSLLETIHAGVPVVVIPHVFDQHRNAKFFEEKDVGVNLDMNELSESKFFNAIKEVLGNPKYKKNMEQLSGIFRDTPLSPRESVVYWTDFVLKHGNTYLRPASVKLAWYQEALLDVLAVFAAALIIILMAGYYMVKKVIQIVRRKKNEKKPKKKRQI